MLKEVALKEICGNDDMNEVKIESFSSGSIDCASEELDNIIRNSIGIQVSLADILIGKKDDESSNDLVSFISLRKNVCEQRQLEQIKKVFQSVHKVLDHNDKLIACEVYGPKEDAVNIFKLALEGGELGEWINWFYSCENADDCKRRGLINISEKHTAENKFRVSEEMLSLSICCTAEQIKSDNRDFMYLSINWMK